MLPGIPIGDVRWGTLGSSASGTTLNVPYPVVRDDDVLVLVCGANVATLYTTVGGSWGDQCRHLGTGDTLAPSLYLATRKGAASLSGNLAVTCPNVATRGRIAAVPAVDLAQFLDTVASTTFKDQSAAQSNNDVPAGSFTRQHGLLIGGWISNAGAHTWTQPTNWTEMTDGDGTVPFEIAMFSQVLSGTTGVMTAADSGSAKSLGQVLCLRPRTSSPAILLAA